MSAEGAPPVVRVGATLGRFVLEGVLGHGAMATVFRARDPKLGRAVAVKVMNLAVAARSEAAERFRREAQAVAALKHPGIVEIHDFVPAEGGEPAYIVAELIEGPTLRGVLDERRGRILPEIAALIGAELAEALALAHERGVIHRDVKPDNVMLERSTTGSRVVITDFGIAQVTGLETMTATGALVGSPAYMCPEQARGGEVGAAADIWALGVLLYEMATGCVPFPGRDPFVVVGAILRGTFRRPSQLTALVGPAYEAAVMRCLAPDPAARYGGARALAQDLRALAADAGLSDGRVALRRFLEEPDALEQEVRARVADAAVQHARAHARGRAVALAFKEISRATAYVPKHAGAHALLAKLESRQRWVRVAAGLVALMAVVGGAWGVRGYVVGRQARAPIVSAAVQEAPAAAPKPGAAPKPEAAPAAAPTTVAATTIDAKAKTAPKASASKRPSPRKRPARSREGAAMVTASATQTTPDPGAAVPQVEPETPAEPKTVIAPPPLGTVRLRARNGSCDPSLDHRAPTQGETIVTYVDVTPGRHLVFCKRGAVKAEVGWIDVASGVNREHVIDYDGQRFSLRR